MPKRYKPNQIIKVLLLRGFICVSQKGSHIKFRHPSGMVTIVPEHKKELPPGTFLQILKQAGLTRKVFENLV